jgi:hypothetical protein
MPFPSLRSLPLALLCLLPAAVGCGGQEMAVNGQVTLDGQPVPGPGTVAFYAEPGTDSPHAAGEIEQGKYEIPAERGLRAGKFRVEITWPKKTGKKLPSADPGMTVDETVEGIPARYNTQSELRVEISPSQSVHDFHLQSK